MSGRSKSLRRGLLEVVAIVGSILLAFAIDAAWQERQEATEVQELLIALRAEFDFHRSELVRHGERWQTIREATGRLLDAAASGNTPPPAVVDSLLNLFVLPPSFDPRQGTLSSATASGQLRLIKKLELRNQLAGWSGVVEELRDNELSGRDFIYSTVVPYLARQGVPLSRALALTPRIQLVGGGDVSAWPAPLAANPAAAASYQSMLADPEFVALASWRYSGINDGEYQDAVIFVDSLLSLLDREIR